MSPAIKTAQVNLRLDPDLKAAAEKAATEDRRSLTSLIEKLLADYISNQAKLGDWDAVNQIRFVSALNGIKQQEVVRWGRVSRSYTIKHAAPGIEPFRLDRELQDVNLKVQAHLRRSPDFVHVYTNNPELRPYFTSEPKLQRGKLDEILECCLLPDVLDRPKCWRVSRFGQVADVRPFREDAETWRERGHTPGKWFSPRFMTEQLADLVAHAAVFSHKFPGAESIEFRCEWVGLGGREVADPDPSNRHWNPHQIARADNRITAGEWPVSEVRNNLIGIVQALGGPTMRLFNTDFDYPGTWIDAALTGNL